MYTINAVKTMKSQKIKPKCPHAKLHLDYAPVLGDWDITDLTAPEQCLHNVACWPRTGPVLEMLTQTVCLLKLLFI